MAVSPAFLDRLRSRLAAAIDWYGPARAFATAGSVLVVCIGAWWLLRAPSPPLENSLPFAGASSTSAQVTATLYAPSIGLPLDVRDITVHVVGAVVAPGVYTIASTSRVVDAVDAAGGPSSSADLSSLNMALPLADADQVFVPSRGSSADRPAPPTTKPRRTNPTVATVAQAIAAATTTGAPSTGVASNGSSPNGIVNINTADAGTLESLPGVGPATAKAIIAHRSENGPFGQPEDLLRVKGIGDGKFAAMRQFVSVS